MSMPATDEPHIRPHYVEAVAKLFCTYLDEDPEALVTDPKDPAGGLVEQWRLRTHHARLALAMRFAIMEVTGR
jgi:hypothetical protein